MSDTENNNTEILYKIYKINNKDEVEENKSFYLYSKSPSNNILKIYYSQYKNYLKDIENKSFNNLYLLYEKYGIDNLIITLIDECKKDELKNKLNNYILNDKTSVNKKFSISNDELKERQINAISSWRKCNLNKVSSYNKDFYIKNVDKAKEYYIKTKDKVFEKALCECGKYFLHNRKANRVIHNNTKHHLNYINSLNQVN